MYLSEQHWEPEPETVSKAVGPGTVEESEADSMYFTENLDAKFSHRQFSFYFLSSAQWSFNALFVNCGSWSPNLSVGYWRSSTLDGGCLRSNKGPWNDPEIMKLVHNAEATFVRQITRVLNDQHNYESYVQIRPLKGMTSDTSVVESGSDMDDQCSPTGRTSSAFPCLTPVREEVRVSDPNAYYSCDDGFPMNEETIESNQGLTYSPDQLPNSSNVDSQSNQRTSFHSEGTSITHLLHTVKEKFGRRNIHSVAKMLIDLLVRLAAFIRTVRFESWRRPNYIHPTMEPNRNSHSNSTVHDTANEDDHVRPCIERLQKLEKAFEELSNKPAAIPVEKDKMLMESLDRIKSVEFDLDKTKRVLHTTVMKQLEIAEWLDTIRASKYHQRRLLCGD